MNADLVKVRVPAQENRANQAAVVVSGLKSRQKVVGIKGVS